MIQIINIEPITLEYNTLYCVGYSRSVPDMIHYTNIELAQVLRYIERTRVVHGVKVQIDDKHTQHVIDYLENNAEELLTEMIENKQTIN